MKLMHEVRGPEGAQKRPFRKLAIAAAVLLSAASLSLVGICTKSMITANKARLEALERQWKLERSEYERENCRDFDSVEVEQITLTLQARQILDSMRLDGKGLFSKARQSVKSPEMLASAVLDEYEREWDEPEWAYKEQEYDQSLRIGRPVPSNLKGFEHGDLGPAQRSRDSLLILRLMKREKWAGEVKRGLEQEKIIVWDMDTRRLRELARDLRIARFEKVEDSLEKYDSTCMFAYVDMMPTVYTVRHFIGTPADVRLQKRQIRGILDGFEARAPRQRAEDSVMLLGIMKHCWEDWFTKRENDHYEHYK